MARVLTRWLLGIVAGAASAAGAVAACSAVTPVPVTGSHADEGDSFLRVTKPPEPVRIEVIGPRPSKAAVWIDGYWHWSGRRWVWRDGVWTVPPEGAYYAPPEIVRLPVPVYGDAGTERQLRGYGMALLYRPGHWHMPDGKIAPVEPFGTSDAGR